MRAGRRTEVDAVEGKYVAVTPLTRTKGRQAQAEVKARYARAAASKRAETDSVARQRPPPVRARAAWTCPDCGSNVDSPRHVRCAGCQAKDPRQTPKLRESRARAISARRQAEAAWEATHPGQGKLVSHDYYAETVFPALAPVGLRTIMERCGVTKSTAWSWRSGRTTPNMMHWQTLVELGRPGAGQAPAGRGPVASREGHEGVFRAGRRSEVERPEGRSIRGRVSCAFDRCP